MKWVLEAFRTQGSRPHGGRSKVQLTPKESLIVSCVTQGMKNKEIALRVGTTEQVVKNYLRNTFDKLGVWSRLELALYVASHGGVRWTEELHLQRAVVDRAHLDLERLVRGLARRAAEARQSEVRLRRQPRRRDDRPLRPGVDLRVQHVERLRRRDLHVVPAEAEPANAAEGLTI